MDPLAQLADIKTPEQISQFPVAIGWWLLLAIIVVSLVIAIRYIIKNQAARKIRKQAIHRLKQNELSISETTQVLKWAAMQYFTRSDVANLSGTGFSNFLLKQLPENKREQFSKPTENIWQQLYQQRTFTSAEIKSFKQASVYWLTHALPPKKTDSAAKTILQENGGQQ